MALAPGSHIDNYELIRPVGSGGMGEVWLGRDMQLRRNVAIKVLRPDVTRNPARVARLEQEARATSALSHPNVCHVYTLGLTPDGHRYIAMEYVDGETLRKRLVATITASDALDIAIQIAAALTGAHAAGVVHRDIKPENVMRRPDGLVKVLDFGLAKLLGSGVIAGLDSTHTLKHTDTGTVMGTVAYMSPEQARAQEVDARTDIWSLGVVLYEMLARRLPFEGPSATDVLIAIIEREPPPLPQSSPGLSREFQRIVSKALRKDRERRYQTAKDLYLDLQTAREELDLASRRSDDAERAHSEAVATASASPKAKPSRARWLATLAAAVGLLAAGVWIGSYWWRTNRRGTLNRSEFVRLTLDPGLQTDVTWSPDGESIAYASDKTGNFDIWVQSIKGGAVRQLTRSAAQDTQPTWSPNGQSIVFRSDRDNGGLFVVQAVGGPERRLTTFGVRPKWAPDGSQVLFASTETASGRAELYTVRLDGRPPQQVLKPFLNSFNYVSDWNWYPDSRRVSVLGVGDKRAFGLYTVPLDGREPTLLEPHRRFGEWGSFEWADGGKTLYTEYNQNWACSIEKLTVVPATMRVTAIERVTTGDNWQTKFAVAGIGRRMALTLTRMQLRAWVYPFDAATGRLRGDGTPQTDADGIVWNPDLNRDGTHVAYLLVRPGRQTIELWTTDVVSGRRRLLAADNQIRDNPKWSPDGHRLVYAWWSPTEQSLAVRSMDSDEEQLVITPQHTVDNALYPFDWFPDGNSVLAMSTIPRPRQLALTQVSLALAPTAERDIKVLTSHPDYGIWQARLSPNGRWISFVGVRADRPGFLTIFVIPSKGAERPDWVQLTPSDEWADKPRWSPDGRLLYYVRRQGEFFNLWALRLDPDLGRAVGQPFQVMKFDSRRKEISREITYTDIGVSPTRLMVTLMEQTGNIWMLDDASPELRR
jgi:eukaryotic-like serine/threonine-protein kinase